MQWVAAHSLSQIVVVVFVVILSVVVVVCRLGPSSSTFRLSFGVGTFDELDKHRHDSLQGIFAFRDIGAGAERLRENDGR